MLSRIRRTLAPPTFERSEDAHAARLLNAVLWGVVVAVLVWGPVGVLTDAGRPVAIAGDLILALLLIAAAGTGQVLMRLGRVHLASLVSVALLYLGCSMAVVLSGGVRAPASGLYVLLVVVAGALLGRGVAAVTASISVLTGLALVYAESVAGWLVPWSTGPLRAWAAVGAIAAAVAAMAILTDRSREELLADARRHADELESRLAALREEGRARTAALDRQIRYLSAIASVSRDIAPLSDMDALVSRTASLTAERLGLHHVGIYVVDDAGEWLDLRASADPEAEDPPAWELRVRAEESTVIGRVASTATPYVLPDARGAEGPQGGGGPAEARAQLALPICAEGRVLGVLDMHSRVQGTFGSDDAAMFEMLAEQVAAGMGNAAALAEERERSDALRAAYGQSVAESWRRGLRTRGPTGVARTAQGLAPAGREWGAESRDALRAGRAVAAGHDSRVVAVPIAARGHVIAVLDARKPAEGGDWSSSELSLLESLCAQLGEALENARLYEDAQRREARERLLGEATARMRASLDPATVLRAGAEEIRAALGLAALDIRLDLAQAPGTEAATSE
jgi:GAF domain-containing protein